MSLRLRRLLGGLLLVGTLSAMAAWPTAPATAAPVAAPPTAAPVFGVGRIDAVMKDRLQRIWQVGQLRGRHANVFAKVGDSITASGSYLSDIGDGNAVLGTHRELASIITYYRARKIDRVGGVAHNSLNRRSQAARSGFTAANLYLSNPAPMQMEYAAINPAVAVIMIGSNDIDEMEVEDYRPDLVQVVEQTLEAGIIPILTTIPDRIDTPHSIRRQPAYNAAIRDIAAAEHVPLIDYWAALQPLPNRGLQVDGLHPTIYPAAHGWQGSVTFTAAGLQYGWNLRNYLTLAMLARVKAVVFDNGAPDS